MILGAIDPVPCIQHSLSYLHYVLIPVIRHPLSLSSNPNLKIPAKSKQRRQRVRIKSTQTCLLWCMHTALRPRQTIKTKNLTLRLNQTCWEKHESCNLSLDTKTQLDVWPVHLYNATKDTTSFKIYLKSVQLLKSCPKGQQVFFFWMQ